MEKSNKARIKPWKNRVKPWKNLVKSWKHEVERWENRGKWSVVGGAFGEALDTLESKGVLKQLLSAVGLVLVDLYLLGSDVGPL